MSCFWKEDRWFHCDYIASEICLMVNILYWVWIMFSYESVKFISEKWSVTTLFQEGWFGVGTLGNFNESKLKVRKAIRKVSVVDTWELRSLNEERGCGLVSGEQPMLEIGSPLPFMVWIKCSGAFVSRFHEDSLNWAISALGVAQPWASEGWQQCYLIFPGCPQNEYTISFF